LLKVYQYIYKVPGADE